MSQEATPQIAISAFCPCRRLHKVKVMSAWMLFCVARSCSMTAALVAAVMQLPAKLPPAWDAARGAARGTNHGGHSNSDTEGATGMWRPQVLPAASVKGSAVAIHVDTNAGLSLRRLGVRVDACGAASFVNVAQGLQMSPAAFPHTTQHHRANISTTSIEHRGGTRQVQMQRCLPHFAAGVAPAACPA